MKKAAIIISCYFPEWSQAALSALVHVHAHTNIPNTKGTLFMIIRLAIVFVVVEMTLNHIIISSIMWRDIR